MIDAVRPQLEARNWQVTPHYILHEPEREIDIYSERNSERLVLQLKSLVRPLTPGEVRRRNEDVVEGINHTAEVVPRLPGAIGFVITNGYRGDYATWDVALRRNVMIGTVEDIGQIAADPLGAIDILKERAGFKEKPSPTTEPHSSHFRLARWNIELRA
jgi:hypothetical protein